MRRFITILCAASICVAVGCEKEYPGGQGRTGFDEKIDGPVNALKPPADDSLLADQSKISREFETDEAPAPAPAATPTPTPAPGPGPGPGPAPAASGASVNQVKAVMAKMAAAAKPGQHAKLPDFFEDADAALIRPLTTDALKTKANRFVQRMRTGARVTLPPQMDSMIRGMTKPVPLQDLIGDASKYTYGQVGQTVVATAPSGDHLTFVQVGSTWKAKFSAKGKSGVAMLNTIQDAAMKFLDEATAGVNDGSITKQTVASKLQALHKKHLGGVERLAAPPSRPPRTVEPGF